MRFLVDECVGKRFADALKKEGYDIIFAGDILYSVSDEMILEFSEKENRILITDDKDFGELVFRLRRPVKGVILLRISSNIQKRMSAIKKLLENYEVTNKFIVLEENAMRSRDIL